MNPFELLKDDHKKVKKLLEELDSTTERGIKTRQELFEKVQREMKVHEAIEEEILYPALKQHAKAKEIVLEGYEEHDVVDRLVGELAQLSVEDESWGAKLKVMKENVEHHIEEEEDEMFSKAREVLDDDALGDLGDKMAARKKELEATA